MAISDQLERIIDKMDELSGTSTTGYDMAIEDVLYAISDQIQNLIDAGFGNLPIHICASDEYDHETGIPIISDPASNQFYLTPNIDEPNTDIFKEWVFVNENWELFGSGKVGERGEKGDKGDTGNGIIRIQKTSSSGKVDTYTIYYTNGTTASYTVTNGSGAVSSVANKVGDVLLNSGDIEYYRDDEDSYMSGSIGSEVCNVKKGLRELENGKRAVFIGETYYHVNTYVNLASDGTVVFTSANRNSAFYYMDLPIGSTLTINVKAGYNVRYFLIDRSDGTWTQRKISDWSPLDRTEEIEAGYNVLIVNINKQDETFMTDADIGGCTIDFCVPTRASNTQIYKYDNVDSMKSDIDLATGNVCHTFGYYLINDGGEAYYTIVDDEIPNEIDIISLVNGKFAKLIQNGRIDIRQYGCKANDPEFDNSDRLNYLFGTNPDNTFIPNGTFYFNSTIFTKGNIDCSSSGILCANSNMLYGVVLCDYESNELMYNNLNGRIRLKVNANKKAKIGVALSRAKQAQINLEIKNSGWAAFRDRYATEEQYSVDPSVEVENGVFNANENVININVTGASDGSSLIGAWINSSDNTYENIITKDVSIGVYTSGAIICAKSVHSWLSNTSMWNDSACFYSHGSGAQLCINEVYQDTMRFGIMGSGSGSIQYYLHYYNEKYFSPDIIAQSESYIAARNMNNVVLNIDTYQTSLQQHKIPKLPPNGNLPVSVLTKDIELIHGVNVREPDSTIVTTMLPNERYKVTVSGNVSTVRSLYHYDKFGNRIRYGSLTPGVPVYITPNDFVDKITLWVDGDAVLGDGILTLTVEKYITPVDGKTTINVKTLEPKSPVSLTDLDSATVGGVYAVSENALHSPVTTRGNEQLDCKYSHGSRSQTLLTDTGSYYRLGTLVNSIWSFGEWIQNGT